MDSREKTKHYCAAGICWAARILGSLLAALVLVIVVCHAFSEEGLPDPFSQPPGVTLEFLGLFAVWAGVVLAWKWEGVGGLLTIGGVIIFHIVEGRLWLNWVFGLFGLVGIMFLLCWRLNRTAGSAQRVSSIES